MKGINKKGVANIALAMGSFAALANAQERPAGAGRQPALDSGTTEDIIVTARLRSERLQDVPVAVTAFGAEEIARFNTDSFQQLSIRTPALSTVNSGTPTGGFLNLRGVGTGNAGPHIDQPVSINVDGAQVSQANIMNLGFYDVERIEILKGPQTLFFGKNSPAGIISIVSAGPGDRLEAKLRAGYEFANKNRFVEGMVSTPITDSLGVRFSGYFSDEEGWLRNISGRQPAYAVPSSLGGGTTPPTVPESANGPGGKTYFARMTLAYKPAGGEFDATLKMAYGEKNFDNASTFTSQIIYCPGGAPQYARTLGQSFSDCKLDRNVEQGVAVSGGPVGVLFPDGKPHNDQKQFLSTLTANYRPVDQFTLTTVSTYYHMKAGATANNLYTGLDYFRTEWMLDQKQFTQEVRLLTSFNSPFNVMLGAYFQHFDNFQRDTVPTASIATFAFSGGRLSGPALLGNAAARIKTDAYSMYGQALWDIMPSLELAVGGRYSSETKRVSAINYPNSFSPDTFAFPASPNQRTFKDFSPDVTLTYKPVSNLTIYGAYRQGFLSGGFDVSVANLSFGRRSLGNVSYKPETVEGGELGIKGNIADRQLSFDAVAYAYTYRDLQVTSFDPTTISNRLTNAGSARVRGAEFNLDFRPRAAPGLGLHGGVAYNPARYGSFRNAPCYVGQTPAAGCSFLASRGPNGELVINPIGPGQVGNVQDLSDKRLVRNSDWSGNVGGSYEQALSDSVKLSLAADASYTGMFYGSAVLEPAARQSAAWRFDGRIALGAPNDRWEVALIGTNLTNKLRAVNAFMIPATGGGTGRTTGFVGDEVGVSSAPRTVTLQATFRY